jgi:hypothetical protein
MRRTYRTCRKLAGIGTAAAALAAVAPWAAVAAVAVAGSPAFAHVTPNIQVLKRGEFVRQALPEASRFFEQQLAFGAADLAAIKARTRWTPSEDEVKVYLGRNGEGRLIGSAVFVWVPSEHGPLGVGVAFDPAGKVLQATVTDVGSEPLTWVRPLLRSDGMTAFSGLPLDAAPDPGKVAPAVTGKMSRYYAEVIAEGVARAQAVERVSLAAVAK